MAATAPVDGHGHSHGEATATTTTSVFGGSSANQVSLNNNDPEKAAGHNNEEVSKPKSRIANTLRRAFSRALSASPVEIRGVLPVPLEERTSTRYSSYFSIWACMNINLLPITFGMLGPQYGLNLRDCSLVIVFFCLLTAALPVYLGTLGPQTGLRQMIQARYSFGRYLVSVPVALNLATLTGFCVVICVVGGQCLSAAAKQQGGLSEAVGIVIIGLLSLCISFCGYDALHQYERFAWMPALISFVVVTGCGGAHLREQASTEPATAGGVLSFGMIIASYMIPYAGLASDFTTYLNPKFPSWRLFLYGYAGLVIPPVLLLTLGAAIGGAVSSVPEWEAGYDEHAVGGVLGAMLAPSGGFGKFVLVVLSLTLLGNIAATMYSTTLNFQILVPQLIVVPRYVFSIVITAIVIPVSIRAATDFFASLENFIAVISYWSAAMVAVLVTEHLVFRKGRYETYDHDAWNCASRLPLGIAAIASGALSFALVIPCMAQTWYVGPIAMTTGDLGFEMAFVVTGLLYLPLRSLEKKYTGR